MSNHDRHEFRLGRALPARVVVTTVSLLAALALSGCADDDVANRTDTTEETATVDATGPAAVDPAPETTAETLSETASAETPPDTAPTETAMETAAGEGSEVTASDTATSTGSAGAEAGFVMPDALPGGYLPGPVAPFVPPGERPPLDLAGHPECESLRESLEESPATSTAWEGFVSADEDPRLAVVSHHSHPDEAAAISFVAGYNAPDYGSCVASGLTAQIPDLTVTLESSGADDLPAEVEHWARVRLASEAFGFETISYTVVLRSGRTSVVLGATFPPDLTMDEGDAAVGAIATDIVGRLTSP